MIRENKTQKALMDAITEINKKIENGKLLKVETIIKKNPYLSEKNMQNLEKVLEKNKDRMVLTPEYKIFIPLQKFNDEFYAEKNHEELVEVAATLATLNSANENDTPLKQNEINYLYNLAEKIKKEIIEKKEKIGRILELTVNINKVAILWALRGYYVSNINQLAKIIEKTISNHFFYQIFSKTYELVVDGKINELIVKNENIRYKTKHNIKNI
ncbi:MAG: hypothetical protein QW153_01330 [Candidatus Bilamarchaeaceae archaeon]